jgi:DNA repair exonuclease SbcCD ATPase subunit
MSARERPQPNEEHRPHDEAEGFAALVHRILARGVTPEERLDQLLRERRRELEGHVARLEETAVDLERREGLLRDSRASLERLLRLGTSDLDSRELDLARLIGDLESRERRLREEEAELARRRGELGAVELKRASLEQRERALEEREEQVSEREAQLAGRDGVASADAVEPSAAESASLLAFVPGSRYRLVELEHAAVSAGDRLIVEDDEYVVARAGASPLPGDRRRCAYLVPAGGA